MVRDSRKLMAEGKRLTSQTVAWCYWKSLTLVCGRVGRALTLRTHTDGSICHTLLSKQEKVCSYSEIEGRGEKNYRWACPRRACKGEHCRKQTSLARVMSPWPGAGLVFSWPPEGNGWE
ncbi:hypothetical protein RRG08_062645 [Elysia crispata]|uniref:Uncharacterized protein n=1 Tax=Elysia crispata TaxID=231223 RepID=A0AAE0YYK8_9GAST|nr:hypothetical protein RRG08_062645 [Elysia crispata]